MEHLRAGKRAAPIDKPLRHNQRVILKERVGYPEGFIAKLFPNKPEVEVTYIPYGGDTKVTETIHRDDLLPLMTTGTTLEPTLPPTTFKEVQAKMWATDLLTMQEDRVMALLEKEFNIDAETTAAVRNAILEPAMTDWEEKKADTVDTGQSGYVGWWLEDGMPMAWTFKEILEQTPNGESRLVDMTTKESVAFLNFLQMDKNLIAHTLGDWKKWKEGKGLGGGGRGNRGRYRLRKQTKRRRKTRKRKSRRRKSSRRRKTRRR